LAGFFIDTGLLKLVPHRSSAPEKNIREILALMKNDSDHVIAAFLIWLNFFRTPVKKQKAPLAAILQTYLYNCCHQPSVR
jgi:hypothetical protein